MAKKTTARARRASQPRSANPQERSAAARKRSAAAPTKSAAPRSRPSAAAAASAKADGAQNAAHGAKTIVFVHGIGNKPPPDILKCQWDEALFGFNLGERSRLAYWVNRIFYPEPLQASCRMPDVTHGGALDALDGLGTRSFSGDAVGVAALLPADVTAREREVLERIAAKAVASTQTAAAVTAAGFGTRVIPLPKPVREFISRRITKAFLKDVHEFLFIDERREIMRNSVLERLKSGNGPFVVIGHSQGSMVAYDALSSLTEADGVTVDLFVTIGSPLGLTEVQDRLKAITRQRKLAVPKVVKRWLNVADPLDPVCADKWLASEYAPTNGVKIMDMVKFNADSPRDPHSGTGYLKLDEIRGAVREAIDIELFQRIAPFTISRDLVKSLERGAKEERHSVLIELRDEWPDREPSSADTVRANVVSWIEKTIAAADPPLDAEQVELDPLASYVSAKLTRGEIERMSAELHLDSVYRVFKNARKRALLHQSIDALQCATAHRGYQALGTGIVWAILDTGIDVDHPHFRPNAPDAAIGRVFDCLKSGPIVERPAKKLAGRGAGARGRANLDRAGLDRNGHGTHVAGIVSGGLPTLKISGIAPQAKLYSYKVLDDEGNGDDAKIIKALDHIYELNDNSSSLVVHGVNLSLGGAFDHDAFGCGDTPICKQLRKLWRQGVLVVLAAGNEGYLEFPQGDDVIGVNSDLSIGDPANLEEAIAVGSIHKTKPHLYGVSYFSSRGPTADGRCKPDVVAPGERIVSCRAGASGSTRDKLYVAMSGTSMAAPHVSGVLACFLSARREFIGYPDKAKELLLAACTDLKRDRMHQGAGMPNLVKMLLQS